MLSFALNIMVSVRRKKTMEKKILIGEKMTKKGVAKNYLLLSLFGIFGIVGYLGIVSEYLETSYHTNMFISIVIFIFIMLFLTPIIGAGEGLEFTNQYISYYHVQGYFNQFREVIRILKGDREVAAICMKTTDIAKLNLSYVSHMQGWAQKGYKLKLTFLLKDGTILSIFPTSVGQMEKGDYESALQLLEENNVEIVDKLNIRPVLSQNSYAFQQYIDSIEEGKKR